MGDEKIGSGRPAGKRTMALLELLMREGYMAADELAERTGFTKRQVQTALWAHRKLSRVEHVYGMTREGIEFLKRERRRKGGV